MNFIVVLLITLAISVFFLYLSLHELICVYRNPFPLFHNGDDRLSEVLNNKNINYKTRSILKDMRYDTK